MSKLDTEEQEILEAFEADELKRVANGGCKKNCVTGYL